MADKFSDMPSVLEHLPRLGEAASEIVRVWIAPRLLKSIDVEVESPIEAVFKLWWDALYPLMDPAQSVRLYPQFGFAPINERNYRADFVMWPTDLDELSRANRVGVTYNAIVLELDGHDFHERTKEQVIARNQRDRDFQEKGYRVLHFSGSEIWRDPYQVFTDVFVAASSEWSRYQAAFKAAQLSAQGA